MKSLFLGLLLLGASASLSAQDFTKTYMIRNANKQDIKEAPIEIDDIEGYRSAVVSIDGKEVPCQMDDLDGDGGPDHLFFLADVKGKSTVKAKIELWHNGKQREYKARTFADILLRNTKIKQKNKHNIYLREFSSLRGTNPFPIIHQHGAVFEGELTAFRIYCSPKQTVDIYGKYNRQLELHDSEFYPDKDQLANGFGDDVLVVGGGVGLGALNGWNGKENVGFDDCDSRTQRVLASGPLRSIVEIVDKNWRPTPDAEPMTLTTHYTMIAGHRDCKVDVEVSVPKGFKITKDMEKTQYFTGITNIRGSKEFNDGKGLRACWGSDFPFTGDTTKQVKQTVGMAICLPEENIVKVANTKRDYGYVVAIPDHEMTYYISFCSDKEKQGYHSAKDWFNYLKSWKEELEMKPLIVRKSQNG